MPQLTYLAIGTGFLGAGFYVIFYSVAGGSQLKGAYSPTDYPGAIATGLMCCLWGLFFLALAGEDDVPWIHKTLMAPWLKLTKWMGAHTSAASPSLPMGRYPPSSLVPRSSACVDSGHPID